MKKVWSILIIFAITMCIMVTVNFALIGAADLNSEDKAAFIVREEWTAWETAFKASLSELDKKATKKIYDDMDFYDMQYRFTERYKNKYTDTTSYESFEADLKAKIKKKRKERNKSKFE